MDDEPVLEGVARLIFVSTIPARRATQNHRVRYSTNAMARRDRLDHITGGVPRDSSPSLVIPLVMPLSVPRWRALNALTLLVVVALNGAAATGAMSGDSIGVLANRFPSLFLPANYVFGIWSLIYAGLVACMLLQLVPSEAGRTAVERLGPWWVACGVLNVAWITLFSFSQFALALIVMLLFLWVLVHVGERLRGGRCRRCCARWPCGPTTCTWRGFRWP